MAKQVVLYSLKSKKSGGCFLPGEAAFAFLHCGNSHQTGNKFVDICRTKSYNKIKIRQNQAEPVKMKGKGDPGGKKKFAICFCRRMEADDATLGGAAYFDADGGSAEGKKGLGQEYSGHHVEPYAEKGADPL